MTLNEFISPFKSTVLGTIGQNGYPFSSYSPCYYEDSSIYIFISDITTHAQNIKRDPRVSALFIEDESKAKQIFARKRISLQCDATMITPDKPVYDTAMGSFIEKQGKMLGMLAKMGDFNLYRLDIVYGEATFGFGDAYYLGGENMNELIPRSEEKHD